MVYWRLGATYRLRGYVFNLKDLNMNIFRCISEEWRVVSKPIRQNYRSLKPNRLVPTLNYDDYESGFKSGMASFEYLDERFRLLSIIAG